MQPKKKCVALNPASQIHYIDHLAVISIIMNMPLLFIEEADAEYARKYYPGLNAAVAEFHEFNQEYLIANYDVLFMSDLWNREDFHKQYQLLEKKYNKYLRTVYCPHGFSDKGFYLRECAKEDITLIYGQNMLDLLAHYGAIQDLNSYIITGNYRYSYYKQHQDFYRQILESEIFNRLDKTKPTILYAPTWLDAEESTTFFDLSDFLCRQLPEDYNLIVKLHPRLELDDVAKYYSIIGKFEDWSNILFIKDFPVYPLMAISDAFMTDLSAMGYDYLVFNKPIFYLNKHKRDSKKDRGLYQYRCGIEIMPEDFAKTYSIIEANLSQDPRLTHIRKEVYEYTFGQERTFTEIKKDIVQAYSTTERFLN